MRKHILVGIENISEVTKALKDFGYTQGSGNIYYPNEPERMIPDFDISFSVGDTVEGIVMSLYVLNEGMLQDIRVKELLLEYLI